MTDDTLYLIAGLGNPGKEYAQTRHNIGFMVVDAIAKQLDESAWRSRFGGEYLAPTGSGLILVKPMTFMNESGGPLASIASYYRVPPERCLVISDDLDQPYGKLRMRVSGGHGGQNGLRSIIAAFGEKFPRLRVGIGRSRDVDDEATVRRVLGAFSVDERKTLADLVTAAATGAVMWRREGTDPAMRFVNTWQHPSTVVTESTDSA